MNTFLNLVDVGVLVSVCVFVFLFALCFQFPDGAGVSQVCWVTGATDLLIALEEYLSRRLPALRSQSVCLQWYQPQPLLSYASFFVTKLMFMFLRRQTPEPSDHSSLNFDFGSRRFWTIKITYVWWISFGFRFQVPSWQLPVILCLLNKSRSVPCPPSNASI
ncbi:hypothetical protein AMECASPLE_037994 [Ameca splendens]|uniref:Uncharacterized protein n=1 Tax=Ameca splendens TaxID=208324 RepID=A0ABV0XL65_9TELE